MKHIAFAVSLLMLASCGAKEEKGIKDAFSEHFYIGEGMIPSGNWSGYPSHRHDENNPPAELDMEETYFYLFDPPQGFGFQSVYKPDGSLNEA